LGNKRKRIGKLLPLGAICSQKLRQPANVPWWENSMEQWKVKGSHKKPQALKEARRDP
jgi:hypothetical protein